MSNPEVTRGERVQTSERTGRRLAGAAGIMMGSIMLSRILGLARDAIISGKLGQGDASDVYMAAFLLPDTLFFLIAGGALSSAFIPVFTEFLAKGEPNKAWDLFSSIATIMFVAVGAAIALGFTFAGPLVTLLAYGFDARLIDQIVPLTRILLPAQLCFFLGGLMMGAQQARGRFLIAGMGPNIYNVGIILGGLLLADWLGAAGFCWGALIGAVAGNFALQVWGVARTGGRYHVSFDWRNPATKRVWKLMLPVIFGLALPQVSIILNRIFATMLHTPGPVSALTRANTLMQAPLALFGQSLSIAVFPTLAAQAALKEWRSFGATISLGMRYVMVLTLPSAALLLVLGRPIVTILLEHGRFTRSDTIQTTIALSYYALGLAAWSAQAVLARAFYALQDTRTPVIIGTAVTLVFIPMNFLFMRTFRMGHGGLALATTVAAAMNASAMLLFLHQRIAGLSGIGGGDVMELRRLANAGIRATIGAAAAAVAAFLVAYSAGHLVSTATVLLAPKVEAGVLLLCGGGVGSLVYIAAIHVLGLRELSELTRLLRRRRSQHPSTSVP